MKKVNENELRTVDGGRWKCNTCGAKYFTYIQAVTHANCSAHYNSRGANIKWCW